MAERQNDKFRFAGFRLDAGERLFFDGERSVPLAPKIFDTLLMLVRNAGRILGKERMLDEIWEGSFVEENNLAQNISLLRRVLGETKEYKFIETVPKYGYRFVAPVTEEAHTDDPVVEKVVARFRFGDERVAAIEEAHARGTPPIALGPPAEIFRPDTRYVTNGDVNIAYQVVGEGPIDIVFVMGWVSHLEYFWTEPRFASFLKRLASFSRLILFDKRGTGLSDRVPIDKLPTLEQRMEDLHAVMDVVGSDRAVLVGVSEGGPMCSLFAATYPERTAGLVMIGTYAKRVRDDDYPWAPTAGERDAFFDLMQREWGTAVGIEERAPSLAADPEFREWWATYLRMGASPGAAVALTRMNAEIDVRNVLSSIRVPTLVIHRTGDMCLKVEEGRYVASGIPGSRFVELPGIDHLPFVGDQAAILDEIELFVNESADTASHDRVLATVMNIRIVDPAAEAAKGGRDVATLLDKARSFVKRQFRMFRGREVAYHNGGVLATFDGPARAIRCASAIAKAAGSLGIEFKAGLHTGECDVVDGVYSGYAVELAEKIADAAPPGSILVSRTVKDLVAGSGLQFTPAGKRPFDGAQGSWELYTVDH
ncbi:MAG TPA: alpha/beta fold hydrolase [Pyrinomonadaceae bacterium]|nr:alpha/beta fold hydrolase [Pyrinomonadaceae bacterium]